MFFKLDHFIESTRSELYDWVNFLSNCGGFLGLLMGGSLLSLVEILYHFVVKRFFEESEEKAPGDADDEEDVKSFRVVLPLKPLQGKRHDTE